MSRYKRYHKYRTSATLGRFLNSARASSQHSTIAIGGPIGRDRADELSPPVAANRHLLTDLWCQTDCRDSGQL
jgi:hypothetical protein